MKLRGIRGAITVEKNDAREILSATETLLRNMVGQNGVDPEEIASVFVTMTPDLNAVFPAEAIRRMSGWETVPLLCACEIAVPGALPRCIRLLVLVNTDRKPDQIQHVYLGEARALRPDLVKGEEEPLTPEAFSS